MKNPDVLRRQAASLDGRDYGAYQSLKGVYAYPRFILAVDRIPKDPYAPPHTGVYRVTVDNTFSSLFDVVFNSITSRIAFRDFLARGFHAAAGEVSRGRRGTGNSGLITIEPPGQAILERNSVIVTRETIEARFFIGLPAKGRRIDARTCTRMLLEELPEIITRALFADNVDTGRLARHVKTAENAEHIRNSLDALRLAAFIADGSLLPRRSGTSDQPLDKQQAVLFHSPESLAVEIDTPHAGRIRGMGIPRGITLIVGGGYHGKSTLLNAVEMGIYNHIPGDGREQCVADAAAMKIRAADGRYVENVDISLFINNLPLRKDTVHFSTENASGSTSQAASIMEAIAAGACVLLMDEDTCATNFMIRDEKMQKLVRKKDEPITTFIDRVRSLSEERGISTILGLGGIGDYFAVSDTVIQMKQYRAYDVTSEAHDIALAAAEKRSPEGGQGGTAGHARVPVPGCIDPANAYNKRSVYAKEVNRIYFGKNIIDLTDIEQLVELSQTKALAAALETMMRYVDGRKPLMEIITRIMSDIDAKGLDALSEIVGGHFSRFRGIDLACAVNRLRTFETS